jgi:hypothetical protein
MRGSREVVTLYRALDLMVYSSRPKAVVPVLRHAIAMLAEQNAVEPPRLRRALSHSAMPPRVNGTNFVHSANAPAGDWEPLRLKLHTIVSGSGAAERAAIAAELGISPTTLRGIVSTSTPGAAVIARAA